MSDRIFRTLLVLGAAGILCEVLACTAQPVPLSAQAGSTVLIPFSIQELTEVGFGGTDFSDPQRGSLVVQLDGQGGFELTTRLALVAAPPVESPSAHDGAPQARNLVLVVDVPTDAPPGTHSIVLVNRKTVGGAPVDTLVSPSPQTLRILPSSILAGGEVVDGAPTQSRIWLGGDYEALGQASFAAVVPEPSFGLSVRTPDGTAPDDGTNRFIAYAQVSVSYPAQVIDVKRVVALEPADTLVWSQDDGAGNLTVYGMVKRTAHPTGLSPLRVVFGLDDPSTPLALDGSVVASLDTARDQFGDGAIQQDWGVTVQLDGIR